MIYMFLAKKPVVYLSGTDADILSSDYDYIITDKLLDEAFPQVEVIPPEILTQDEFIRVLNSDLECNPDGFDIHTWEGSNLITKRYVGLGNAYLNNGLSIVLPTYYATSAPLRDKSSIDQDHFAYCALQSLESALEELIHLGETETINPSLLDYGESISDKNLVGYLHIPVYANPTPIEEEETK